MKLLIRLTAFLIVCLPYGEFREYHYNRPQTPFHVNSQIQAQPRHIQVGAPTQIAARYYAPPATSVSNAVIQNYGYSGTVHIAQQPSAPGPHAAQGVNTYPTSYAASGVNQVSHHQGANVYPANKYASAVAASYNPQHHQQHHHQQQQQQLQYTTNVNPLIQYSSYPQQQQPQQQQHVSQYQVVQLSHQQVQQHAPQYNGNGQQQQQQQQYQQQQASGPANGHAAAAQAGQTLALNGNYVSQSEAGQLHSYQHQQQPIGDTRPFTRQITTCYPNGQCDTKQYGAGQAGERHQHIVAASRVKAVPVADKCRRITEENKSLPIAATTESSPSYPNSQFIPPASSDSYAGALHDDYHPVSNHIDEPIRPNNRRLFPYSEVTLPNDPYN